MQAEFIFQLKQQKPYRTDKTIGFKILNIRQYRTVVTESWKTKEMSSTIVLESFQIWFKETEMWVQREEITREYQNANSCRENAQNLQGITLENAIEYKFLMPVVN